MKHRLQKTLAALLCTALLCLTALPLGAWAAEESSGTPALKIDYNGEEYTLSADDPDFSEFVEAMEAEDLFLKASYDSDTTTFTIELQDDALGDSPWGFDEITITGTGMENVKLTSTGSVAFGPLTIESVQDFTAIGGDAYSDPVLAAGATIACQGAVEIKNRYPDCSAVDGTLSITGAASVSLTGYVNGSVDLQSCGPITATSNSYASVFSGTSYITNCGDLTVTNTNGRAVSSLTFTSDSGSSVALNSTSYAINGTVTIDTTGSVSITSTSGTISGNLTVNNASDVSIRSDSGSIGGSITLNVRGNVKLSSPSGSSAGNLTIKNAQDVTITGNSETALLSSGNNTVSIYCTGDLLLRNERGSLVGTENPPDENLAIQNAGSITLEATSNKLPAVTGDILIENCAGPVLIVNKSGAVANHKLTIGSADNVTVQGNTSGYLFGTSLNSKSAVEITCSGAVNLSNGIGGIVYDDLTVKNASALTLNGSCVTPLVYGTLTADNIGTGEISIVNQIGNISSSDLTITSNGPVTLSGNDNDALVKNGNISIESTSGDVVLENKGSSSTSITSKDLSITSGGAVSVSGNSSGNGMLVNGKTTITTPGSVSLSNQNGGISSGDFSVNPGEDSKPAGDVTITGAYAYYLFSESAYIFSSGDVHITNTEGPLVEGVVGFGDLRIPSAASITLTGNSAEYALIRGSVEIESTRDVTIENKSGALVESENTASPDVMMITTPGNVTLSGNNATGTLALNGASFWIESNGFLATNTANPTSGSFADTIGTGKYLKYGDEDSDSIDFSEITEAISPDPDPEPEPDPKPDPEPTPDPEPDTPEVQPDTGRVVATTLLGGAAIWGGYELTTRVILHQLLPQDAAIPTNRGALALLVWNTAGRPEPAASPSFTDISDSDLAQAAQWCVEQGLLDARSETTFVPDSWMPKFRTIAVWRKAFPEQKIF